jgi:predicted nucleic acid-binding protein
VLKILLIPIYKGFKPISQDPNDDLVIDLAIDCQADFIVVLKLVKYS